MLAVFSGYHPVDSATGCQLHEERIDTAAVISGEYGTRCHLGGRLVLELHAP
jgi:hypothetical protein